MAQERGDIAAIIALCQEALERIGPNGSFRVRVLLEMAVIQLEIEAALAREPETPSDTTST